MSDEYIAQKIHYPQCWDTAVYPTLASAIWELTPNEYKKCNPDCCAKEEVEPLSFERDFMWPANTSADNCYKWISVERLKELFAEFFERHNKRKHRTDNCETELLADIKKLFGPLVK